MGKLVRLSRHWRACGELVQATLSTRPHAAGGAQALDFLTPLDRNVQGGRQDRRTFQRIARHLWELRPAGPWVVAAARS
jgi:hypothetical protein